MLVGITDVEAAVGDDYRVVSICDLIVVTFEQLKREGAGDHIVHGVQMSNLQAVVFDYSRVGIITLVRGVIRKPNTKPLGIGIYFTVSMEGVFAARQSKAHRLVNAYSELINGDVSPLPILLSDGTGEQLKTGVKRHWVTCLDHPHLAIDLAPEGVGTDGRQGGQGVGLGREVRRHDVGAVVFVASRKQQGVCEGQQQQQRPGLPRWGRRCSDELYFHVEKRF